MKEILRKLLKLSNLDLFNYLQTFWEKRCKKVYDLTGFSMLISAIFWQPDLAIVWLEKTMKQYKWSCKLFSTNAANILLNWLQTYTLNKNNVEKIQHINILVLIRLEKIWIFTRNIPTIFASPSARRDFLSALPP